jgi:NADH dehydrogenase (ubiquinone) 1 alpha subcomplex subunit 5
VYEHTLAVLKDEFPKESLYRQSTENLTKARKDIVDKNDVNEVIEQQIGAGLIEEILVQAAEEFQLAQTLAKNKVWEDLEEKPLPDQWVYFQH